MPRDLKKQWATDIISAILLCPFLCICGLYVCCGGRISTCGTRNRHRRKGVARPRPPFHHKFKPIYQPIQGAYRKLKSRLPREHDPNAFPILRLPPEIRSLIYDHLCGTRDCRIQFTEPWIGSDHRNLRMDLTYMSQNPYTEDTTVFELDGDSGFLAYHGRSVLVPTNLLLVCKQMYQEIRAQFLSTTGFEVAPLTPHDDAVRIDPLYKKLRASVFLPVARKILVLVEMSRVRINQPPRATYHEYWLARELPAGYTEIDLGECVKKVTLSARALSHVLRRASSLKAVVIDWVDDFADDVDTRALEMRADVLKSFTQLRGVDVRLGKLVVAERSKWAIKKVLNEALGDVDAN